MHDTPRPTLLLCLALLPSCAGTRPDAAQSDDPVQSLSASAASSTPVTRVAPPSPAALIMEARKMFVSNGGTCEAWELAVPNMLEDQRGRARHAASEGEPSVLVEIERQGDDLMLEAPCFGDKKGLCLACELLPKPASDLRAFARQDECEAGKADASAGVRGCAAALATSSRAQAKRVLDGSLRDDFIARVSAARVVSRGAGADCMTQHVRKAQKRLFLDWEASEYPEEVISRAGGVVSINEVAEPHPRYKPRGEGAIGIGCCGGSDYHVLAVGDGTATLRKMPVGKGAPSVLEFRFSACPR